MIRVAFLLNFSKDYKGGINYLKNLLYTNSVTKFPNIKFYVFVPSDIEQEYIDIFSPYAQIIHTSIFKINTLPWFLNKAFNVLFKYQLPLYLLLKKHKINIVSHSFFWGNYKSIKTINWIPDFQCLHFPELWSKKELHNMLKLYTNITIYSDRVILSSYDALNDYKNFAPAQVAKAKVLQFVSQPGEILEADNLFQKIKVKYNLENKFFYLPNQFWSHKNHIVVIKAINLLVQKGLNPILITTGVMNDLRGNNQNLITIKEFIKHNALEENILLLGLIPYEEVLILMRKCVAVINPSFFEGWSSTIEEAKSIGKTVIISNIPVHKEQNPGNAFYFNPKNEKEVASILETVWENDNYLTELSNEQNENLKIDLSNRTKTFSEKYYNVILDLLATNE